MDFSLQQQNISSDIPKYYFPYKAHLDKLLSTKIDEDPSVLFTKDESKGIDSCSVYKAITGNADSSKGNEGQKKREILWRVVMFLKCAPL